MVQVIETEDPRGRIAEMLGMQLGQSLGSGINSYFANKALEGVINDESLANADTSVKMGKLQSALQPYGEAGQQILQQRFQIEQMANAEREQEVLGKVASGKKVSPHELKRVSPQNQMKIFEIQKRREAGRSVFDSLKKAGYPEETAALWQNQMENAPIGGQSDVIRNVNDLIRRSQTGKGAEEPVQNTTAPEIEIPGIESEKFPLDFPQAPESLGRTPADVVKMETEREKTNIPVYSETTDRLNALDDEYRDIQYLQELNNTPGALPTGYEKWNVDWETGDLRVKALSSPESQAYVKTIARMARSAKNFFPGRVTNFDLDQFKSGFATLANSPEGRRLISDQMATANRIAYLKDETLKAAYDHYGTHADPMFVKKVATENYRKLKGQLENKLKSLNQQADQMVKSQERFQAQETSDRGRGNLVGATGSVLKPLQSAIGKKPIEEAKTLDELFPL